MTHKFIEVRDKGTFVPCLALRVSGLDHVLMRRAGYSVDWPLTLFINLVKNECQYDPYSWGGKYLIHTQKRTMSVAHNYVHEHWDDIESGAVVDVEFVLGETNMSKESEAR